MRRLVVTALGAILALSAPVRAEAVVGPAPCLSAPVAAPVIDGFRDPGCRWCAGNRGWESGIGAGATVKAAGSGIVTFAGSVAGTLYVVISHASGLRTTYGRLGQVAVATGQGVRAGDSIGTTGSGLFFGVRRGGTYLDPGRYLWRLLLRARLVPTDGSPARRSSRPRWSCTAWEQGR